jgi:hypothetical protein
MIHITRYNTMERTMCEITSFGEGGTEEFEVIAMVKHVFFFFNLLWSNTLMCVLNPLFSLTFLA